MKRHGRPIKYGAGVKLHPKKTRKTFGGQIWDVHRTKSRKIEIATSSCPTSSRPALHILELELNQFIRKKTGESNEIQKKKKNSFPSSKTVDFWSTQSISFKKPTVNQLGAAIWKYLFL